MAILSFGEYRPDVSDYRGQTSQTIKNVLPRGDGYGPFASLSAATSALPSACRGAFFARNADGSVSVFAGTSTRLYELDNTALTWTDVSKSGSAYSALSSTAQWQFVQFNNYVVAVQQNVPPQVFDLTSSTEFADLGGSPPNAAYVSVVNRFLVLGCIASHVYRVQWSDLNNITNWSSGQADSQDLADGGIVSGIAGGEFGVIFQGSSIRRMTYAPGSPYVFGIDRISVDDGLLAPYSLVQAGDRIFFLSPQGFKMLLPGGYPQPIGNQRVDRTFFADVDLDNPQLVIGSHDPRSQRVFWAYKSLSGPVSGTFDKVLCHDWSLNQWTYSEQTGQYIASLARPGLTLENIDTAYGSDIDTITLASLDNISSSALQSIAGINVSAALGFFTGASLEATMITPEQGDDAQRFRVRGMRPITDCAAANCSVVYRETAQSASVTSAESTVNSIGICEQNVTARYARGKMRIPAGSTWTFAAGVEPDIVTVGKR